MNPRFTPAEQAFMTEYLALCEKHRLCLVPTYEAEVSAHDPQVVVQLDNFWRDYIVERTWGTADLEGEEA